MLPDPNTLANAFAVVLEIWLTPDEWAEMRRRNATSEYGDLCCASHDFCDANMAMLEAWENVAGAEPTWLEDEETKENLDAIARETTIWNEAWSVAKARFFTGSRP